MRREDRSPSSSHPLADLGGLTKLHHREFLILRCSFVRKHPAKTACRSFGSIPTLEQRWIVLVHLDELDQALNSEVGERQDPVFSDAIDPDDTVLDFHFIGDVPPPILVFFEIPGDLGDRRDMMDLVDVGGHAARTEIADAGGIQFQGSSSSNRWAGWAAMRERTSLSQACGSTPFLLAVTIRLYIEAARCPPRSDPQNSHDFLPRAIPRSPRSAALLDKHTRPS